MKLFKLQHDVALKRLAAVQLRPLATIIPKHLARVIPQTPVRF